MSSNGSVFQELRRDITTAEEAILAAKKRLDILEKKVAGLEQREIRNDTVRG